jgi:nitrate reductase NapE component
MEVRLFLMIVVFILAALAVLWALGFVIRWAREIVTGQPSRQPPRRRWWRR